MRGYFQIGVEGISKSANVGALYRTTNAFGGSFVFAVGSPLKMRDLKNVDTSGTAKNLPLYEFESAEEMLLPKGCAGGRGDHRRRHRPAELPPPPHGRLRDGAGTQLPLRRDGGPLRPHREDPHQIRDQRRPRPNALMYDRVLSMSRFAPRPTRPGGPTEPAPVPEFGRPL